MFAARVGVIAVLALACGGVAAHARPRAAPSTDEMTLAPPPVDPLGPEVARGWYLWRTGQDQAAIAFAAQLVADHPTSLSAHELNAAMQVVAGNGASLEAQYREWWGAAPADPIRRVALGFAVTFRHAEAGTWCDDVSSLLAKVIDGDEHYFATVADRERERRCTGATGHADAEFIRFSRVPGSRGWADGMLARMDAGYIKEDLPDALAEVWAQSPERVDRAGALWSDRIAGPSKAGARKAANQALKAAAEASDPVLVHAAAVGYAIALADKDAEQARARLRTLDAAADPTLVRTTADVADPPIYGEIDLCTRNPDFAAASECIAHLELPDAGSAAAYAWYQRRLLAEQLHRPDEVYAAARAAHVADPTVRFHARQFARMSLDHLDNPDDVALGLSAIEVALAGVVPEAFLAGGGIETVPESQRASLARELEVRGELLRASGRAADAIADLVRVRVLQPTPRHQLLVGIALAEAGRGDEAALELAYGLAKEVDDTKTISLARDALRPLAVGWLPTGVNGMIAAAKRPIGEEGGPAHPLVGAQLTDPALLPDPPPAPADPKARPTPPGIRVVVTWASWAPASLESLSRVATIAAKYADQGVTAVALGVDAADVRFPGDPDPNAAPGAPAVEPIAIAHRHAGPSAMRGLKSVALPTVVVVDGKGTVVAALSPYDRGSLDLETALDGLLPKP